MEASVNVNNSHNDSMYFKMRSLIAEINKYLTARTEDSILLINKRLQSFSVTIDVNIFDPDTNLGAKFFVSLYNLFTKIESQSQTSWYCVDVLCNASRNPIARKALITTYNFIPSLSRLLSDQLSEAKKKKLLKLMQDLSCGIKISWQFPELPHLLKKLTKWVETQEEQIVSLSLGILVNLSYKNLPVVYTLSRSIDIKKFLRFCLPLRGSVIEIHVCKLMVILDYMHTDIPNDTLIKFVEPTFVSIFEAFKNDDSILLRQIVDFFLDVIGQSKEKHILRDYELCGKQIENLLQLVDNSLGASSGDSGGSLKDEANPECISLILEFINSIILHDVDSVVALHPKIVHLAISWVNSEWVSEQALLVLTKIVEKSTNEATNNAIFQSLTKALPAFLLVLQSNAVPSNMRNCRRLRALLRLLRGMLRVVCIRPEVLRALNEELMAKVFEPLQSECLVVENLPYVKWDDVGFASTDVIDAYLYGLALVVDLAQYGANWLGLRNGFTENRKIHMIVAQALNSGTVETKTLALEVCKHSDISTEIVASTTLHFQPISSELEAKTQNAVEMSFPAISFSQMERLDQTLDKLKKSLDENDTANIATSQLMELYEYKLARMGYAEKSALNSVEAATERCAQLQHQLAQIVAEQNKMQQLLFHNQLCLEQTTRSREDLKECYTQEKNRAQAALGKIKVYEGQIKSKDKALKESEVQLTECEKQIGELSKVVEKLQAQLRKKEQVIQELVESGNKSEKNLQKSEELLKKSNSEMKNLKSHISSLEERLEIKEMKLSEVTEQLKHAKQVLETITKVAANSQLSAPKPHE